MDIFLFGHFHQTSQNVSKMFLPKYISTETSKTSCYHPHVKIEETIIWYKKFWTRKIVLNRIIDLKIQSAECMTQITFTCSKSTIETIEKIWNMFKVNNENIKRHWRRSGVLLLILNIFHTLFWCFYCCRWTSKC